MWLYVLAFFLLIFGIVGSVLSGGIFTIVLIPLGVIALISALVFGAFGRSAQSRHGGSTNANSSIRAAVACLRAQQHPGGADHA